MASSQCRSGGASSSSRLRERSALYAELDALGAQAWMTGADAAVFAEIEGKAEVFEVLPGEVKRT